MEMEAVASKPTHESEEPGFLVSLPADALGITAEQLENQSNITLSEDFTADINTNPTILLSALDALPDTDAVDPAELAIRKTTIQMVAQSVAQLSPREQRVLKARYDPVNIDEEPENYKQIGSQEGGITNTRVKQVEAAALYKIRKFLLKAGIEGLLEDTEPTETKRINQQRFSRLKARLLGTEEGSRAIDYIHGIVKLKEDFERSRTNYERSLSQYKKQRMNAAEQELYGRILVISREMDTLERDLLRLKHIKHANDYLNILNKDILERPKIAVIARGRTAEEIERDAESKANRVIALSKYIYSTARFF